MAEISEDGGGEPAPWWRDAVVYEIYVRSFADSDGDGVGDLPGILDHLDHVASLGADAVWLTPFYPSPMHDHGYDVSDYCDVDPTFGTLRDFDALLARAHELGLRVFVDVVPNHTSRDHPWFREAIADPASPRRGCYVFRPGKPDGSPPNDWQSVFGGPAWTRESPDGEFYLHLFDASQPDLDWRNPAVHSLFESVLRFWLDRGVDGFRIDVAHAVMKDPELRDGRRHAWDQDEVFEVWEEWRRVLDEYDDRTFVGEVFLYDQDRVAQYVGPTRLQQAFNFSVARLPFEAAEMRATVARAVELFEQPGTSPTWVLSNHDLVRHRTRFGGGAVGLRRARAATLFVLGLPGAPYLFQGEELGLEQTDVPPPLRQDPTWFRSGEVGRDGCRTPLPWTPDAPGFGFTTGSAWLPFDPEAPMRNVVTESGEATSTLSFYRRALDVRRSWRDRLAREVRWLETPPDVAAFARTGADGTTLVVLLNTSTEPIGVDVGGEVREQLLTSGRNGSFAATLVTVPAETALWVTAGTVAQGEPATSRASRTRAVTAEARASSDER